MRDDHTDQIAREAARLLVTGAATDVTRAIHAAAALLAHDAPLPAPGRVRAHVRGMSMQAQGDDGYAESVRVVWRTAEEIMTVIEEAMPAATTLLAGRAVQGLIDGGVTLHVRVYTTVPIRDIVDVLVERGYAEPDFETAETRFGRLDRVRFEEEGVPIVITRCPTTPGGRLHATKGADRDLFDDRPVPISTLEALRRRLAEE